MNKHARLVRNLGILLAATAMLGACGKDDKKAPATQVAARVNGAEISVHQINDVLAKAQGVTQANADQAKREILDRLIEQQLAIEQAEAAKLDRNPNVMRAVEAARREILARAHLDQIAAGVTKATTDEARKYYAEHPELFSARRIYSLQEVLIGPEAVPAVRKLVAQNKSMQEISTALEAAKVAFAANAGVRAAEQVPLDVAAKLQGVKDGQTAVIEVPNGAMVVHVVGSQTVPVSQDKALPSIETFLTNQRRAETVAAHLKSLREKAKIEQVGEFAQAAPATAPAAKDAAKAPTAAAPQAPAPQEPPAGIKADSIAKGVAGLK
jgi:EpsD family peptidyl-prolyl cis-trans isomerase